MVNRIIYNQQELFVFPTSGEQENGSTFYLPQFKILKKIEKIQNINYSIEQLREDAKGFGQKINIFRGTRSSPQGNLTFSYIPDGITNENRLGFNVGHFNKNFNGNMFSGICTNDKNINRRDFYLAVNKNTEDIDSASYINQSFIFPNTQEDVIHPKAKDFQLIHFQDCYLNSYNFDLRLNQLPKIEQNYIFNNIIFYSSGSGINYTNLNIKSGFNEKLNNIIILPKDVNINQPFITGQNILTPNNLNLYITTDNDIVKFHKENIQGANFSINFDRKIIRSINYRFPIIEKVNFPVNGEVNISLLIDNTSLTGSFFNTLKEDKNYDIALRFNPNPLKDIKETIFTISGCKFDNINYNSSIGDNKSAELKFIFNIDADFNSCGLFASGNLLRYKNYAL